MMSNRKLRRTETVHNFGDWLVLMDNTISELRAENIKLKQRIQELEAAANTGWLPDEADDENDRRRAE